MKISAVAKILIILFLLIIPIACEKEETAIVKRNDNTAEVKRLTLIADNYFSESDYKNAYDNYKKILSISDTVKDRIDYVDALISLGYIYQYQGDYIQSEEMVSKILPHLKYMKKPRFAWNAYSIQGFNYFKTDNLERALFYYRKALHLKTSAFRKWSSLNCIGIVYMKQKKYRAAAYIFEKVTSEGYYAEKIKTNTADRFDIMDYSIMLNNLGICYYNLKNPEALNIYNKALKIRLKINDRENISTSYTVLSEYYLKKDPALARKYAQLGYKKASEINFYSDQKYCLSFLVHSTQGNELKKYTNMYINFTDSISRARLKQKNQFSDIKYYFQKDKDENLELKTQKAEHDLEIQREKNRSFISFIIISITIFMLIYLFIHMSFKGRKEKKDAVFKNEIRISDKLELELEKDIYETLSFAENNNLEKPKNKEDFLNNLNRIYSKTRNISRENSAIQTDENYTNGLKEMISKYTGQHLNIIINGLNTFSWHKIDRVKKIIVFRVLQEIFDQMKTLNNASLASLTFKKEEKNILIIYADNGTKINPKYTILEKRLQNVENRIKTIKGTLNFDANSENGFKITFKIPI